MIDNQYATELPWSIDYQRLSETVTAAFGSSVNHQYLVDDYPYMQELRKRFPLLGMRWNIYKFRPHTGLGVHIDAKRLACVNIPVEGTEESITRFYASDLNMKKVYNEQRVLFDIQDSLEEVFNFTLARPTLINNAVPHSVRAGSKTRVIVSWGLQGVDYNQAKQILCRFS